MELGYAFLRRGLKLACDWLESRCLTSHHSCTLFCTSRSLSNSVQASSQINMRSGYTCQRCLSSLGRAASARSIPRHVRSGGYGITSRRQYTQVNSRAKAFSVEQKRPVSTAEATASEDLNKRVFRNAPGDLKPPPPVVEPEQNPERVLLQPDNLFHSFSNSPSPNIRRRAAFMKSHAYCPHPHHRQTRIVTSPHDPEARKTTSESVQPPAHVKFECPDCGIPVYCSESHWMDDYEHHAEICDTLRQANEDDHDLNSGRFFPEFEYPGPQIEEILTNMTNWDTYLYTREYNAINSDRSMRQVTRLLTYPITIASVLHELSPYNIRAGGRLTTEGLKSLSGTFLSIPPFTFTSTD